MATLAAGLTLALAVLAPPPAIRPALAQGDEAGERAERERELARLRQQIAALEKRLAEQSGARTGLAAQLRQAELGLARLAQEIDTLRSRLDGYRRELAAQGERQRELDEELLGHRANLRRQLLAAHRVGRLQMLQLVLNQQDPGLVSRVLTYASYLNRARLQAIAGTRAAVRELEAVRARIEKARDGERRAHTALVAEREALQVRRAERGRLLASIEGELAQGNRRLERLRRDGEQLEELIRSLESLLADIPDNPLQAHPFRKLRGRLPWPAKGELAERYGAPRGVGDLRWRGILIAAREGNNVRAVHHGRVVFADWLPGLGLLAIVDHDDGYMSLYGYNQTLLKETGDWVGAGDIIATVGDSGGQRASGLYFEIRKNGKPVNPLRWITGRYSRAGAG